MVNRIADVALPAAGPSDRVTTEILDGDSPALRLVKKHTHVLMQLTREESVDQIDMVFALQGVLDDQEVDGLVHPPCLCADCTGHRTATGVVKREMIRRAGRTIAEKFSRVDAVSLACEAWSVYSPKPHLDGVEPDRHADRQHTVIVMAQGSDGDVVRSHAVVEKDEEGHIRPLEFYQPSSDGKAIEVDGLLAAFWEGVQGKIDQGKHPSRN